MNGAVVIESGGQIGGGLGWGGWLIVAVALAALWLVSIAGMLALFRFTPGTTALPDRADRHYSKGLR